MLWIILLVSFLLVIGSEGSAYRPLYYFINPLVSTKATAILRSNGTGPIVGYMEFASLERFGGPIAVRGWIRNLTTGEHGFHVHQLGDLTDGCKSAGAHFNPSSWTHGAQTDVIRHIGDLGNVRGDRNGQANILTEDDRLSLQGRNNIIGRTIIVHALRDDLGRGGDAESMITGNAGARIACGIIGLTEETIDRSV